jgi:hypothetical protein
VLFQIFFSEREYVECQNHVEKLDSTRLDVPIVLPVDRSGADDDAPIIFPEAFNDIQLRQKVSGTSKRVPAPKPKTFKLTVSSLVISTNAFGDFSKLTLISETIDDSRLVNFATDCQNLWQKFVNQPQTARCLLFLLALGVMCERLAGQYDAAIEAYSKILNLDVNDSSQQLPRREWQCCKC